MSHLSWQRGGEGNDTNGMAFFDQGHGEYLKAYRKARKYLPTGSFIGGYLTGATKNKPMERFLKDANFKDSKHSLFVQAADLIAFAAVMLRAKEENTLSPWQETAQLGDAYDDIPKGILSRRAATRDPRGIVRL